MPTVPNAQSTLAPGVGERNGNLALVWGDPSSGSSPQALNLAAWTVQNEQFGASVQLPGANSAAAPSVAWWNGVFYVVFRGENLSAGDDTTLYFTITDLAGLVGPAPLPSGVASTYRPALVALPGMLVVAYADSNNAISYVTAQSDWLINSTPSDPETPGGLWGQPTTIPGTANVTGAPAFGIVEGSAGNVWVAAWRGTSGYQYLACVDEAWGTPQKGNIPGSPSNLLSLVSYDGVLYALWTDATIGGAAYATYDPSTNTWSNPREVPNGPGPQALISATPGSEGIFIGFNDPGTQQIGAIRLQL
jgi:hypothetical protein